MPRKLRIEYPGAMYHVMNRGDQRENIFRDDQDRQRFLSDYEFEVDRRAITHGHLDLRLQPAESKTR